ncbi:MAG: HlyD family secretion protein [Sporomusaceae bacterium]|nr:HlyD family secretion protein [Sporomusaceae bacterium]
MIKIKNFSKRQITIAASAVVGVLTAAGFWWWTISSSIISTDDARVKNNIVNVSTKIPGQIDKLLVKEGEYVEAGQILAEIDSSSLKIQVEQAQANLNSTQAKLASLQVGSRPQQVTQSEASVEQAAANLANAQKNYERVERLFEQGAIAEQQRDASQTALKVAESQYNGATAGLSLMNEGATEQDRQAAKAQVDQAFAALKNAQLQLEYSVIKAPVAGVVAKVPIDIGEMVAVGQTLYSVTNPADAWIEANIEETEVGKVKLGQQVDFIVDAYPGKTLKGEVMDIGAATGSQFALLPADNSSGNFTKVTQRLAVKIKVIDAENLILKPGMSSTVKIHTR